MSSVRVSTTSLDPAPARRRGGHAILVTPGAIDGYPPVQHQARLLAGAGLDVEVVTPLLPGQTAVGFTCPGVRISTIASDGSPIGKALRYARFCAAIARARRRAGPGAVEIAYDPLGMVYSDFAPFRPRFRIAHFHETLREADPPWYETRVRRALSGYQLIATADEARSRLFRDRLGLSVLPVAVPNYPLRSTRALTKPPASSAFEVVYAGALGASQKLDLLVESVPSWPENAHLTLIGQTTSAFVDALRKQAGRLGVGGRVRFPGWIALDDLEWRLAEADLGVLFLDPSIEQFRTALGASNKRYQYMQAGLPQIGDMNPGIADLLESDGIGLCVGDYTPASVASIVATYVDDRERCRLEGERARHLHVTRYYYERAFEPVLARVLDEVRGAH